MFCFYFVPNFCFYFVPNLFSYYVLISVVSFSLQKQDIRQTWLKERLRAALNRQQVNAGTADCRYFRITVSDNEVSVCRNSFCNLFALYRTQWERLKSACLGLYSAGPIRHGNRGKSNRAKGSIRILAEPSVIDFLEDVCSRYGEMYATRFVRDSTGFSMRKDEDGLVELPSSYTKRRLYLEYCYSRGYKPRANHKGSYGRVAVDGADCCLCVCCC